MEVIKQLIELFPRSGTTLPPPLGTIGCLQPPTSLSKRRVVTVRPTALRAQCDPRRLTDGGPFTPEVLPSRRDCWAPSKFAFNLNQETLVGARFEGNSAPEDHGGGREFLYASARGKRTHFRGRADFGTEPLE
jgi:hypothetical protein